MATKYDMLTSEGSLALTRAVSTGAKLVIRCAQLCNVTDSTIMSTVTDVAGLTYNILSFYFIENAEMTCTSYLPSQVDVTGDETGKFISALDMEFTYMPNDSITYNTVAVLADMYYAVENFEFGHTYNVGTVVKYTTGNVTTYYQAKVDISNTYNDPTVDTEQWEKVNVVESDNRYLGSGYVTISEQPLLLYVSKTASDISIGSQMEIDYKVRIYIDHPVNTYIDKFVVFDTLGLQFNATAQLDLLAEFANNLQAIRYIASKAIGG